ncbi:hypothetical protein O6H91_09G122800 [Diphasiastrum complanatum]|uniref:Uncharacterized protein n=1 Tax=Diphasiastrum complanatum TaxID=34168 RepID=A0ACC2CU76_DIPCM|nr:hypothetical protein O6H91_09G122800 [Diphasiastrum complanatum]
MAGMLEREADAVDPYSYQGHEHVPHQPSAPPISLLEEATDQAPDRQATELCSTDTQSCWRVAREGLVPGAVFGGVMALSRARNIGLKLFQILPAIAFATIKCSTASGIFLGLEEKLKKSRGVHDILNSMLAGGSATVWVVALNAFRPFVYSDRLLRILDNKVRSKGSFQNFLTMFALGSTLGGLVHILKDSVNSQAIDPPSTQSETPSRDLVASDYQMENDSRSHLDDS